MYSQNKGFAIVGKIILVTIASMKRFKGFSLVEVLATMTILGILATISAPEYYKLRERSQFQAEVQAIVDTIVDARNAAITNKKCSNDSNSVMWKMIIDTTPFSYELRCFYDDSNSTVERTSVSPIFAEIDSITLTPAATATVEDITFSFFSGPANAKLQFTESSTLRKAESIHMVMGQRGEIKQQGLCFNRVAGFPTFNKSGSECQTY